MKGHKGEDGEKQGEKSGNSQSKAAPWETGWQGQEGQEGGLAESGRTIEGGRRALAQSSLPTMQTLGSGFGYDTSWLRGTWGVPTGYQIFMNNVRLELYTK